MGVAGLRAIYSDEPQRDEQPLGGTPVLGTPVTESVPPLALLIDDIERAGNDPL